MRLALRTRLNLLGAAICLSLLAFALYAQHGLALEPCNMCILQRFAVAALGLLFLLAAMLRLPKPVNLLWGLTLLLSAAATLTLALRQVWMQAQPLGSLPSCGADIYALLDMLPWTQVVTTVWNGGGECQAITWSWLGLSMAGWVCVASLGLAFLAIIAHWPRALAGLDQPA
jgi:protein dithiol:quinone oxidoreductase